MENNEKFELTPAMMHAAEDMLDQLRAERFRHPKMCPKCGGNKLHAWVPNAEYVAFKLSDGKWEYHEEGNYDGDSLDWYRAKYHCDDCDTDFEPTNANGWAAEAIALKRNMEG